MAGAIRGLKLTDVYGHATSVGEKYSWLDANKNSFIEVEEVAGLDDARLIELLDNALDTPNWQFNHHDEFFCGLSVRRIVALFRGGKLNPHYLTDLTNCDYSLVISAMDVLLDDESMGPTLADKFLLGTEMAIGFWPDVFMGLQKSHPVYANSRTSMDYTPLVKDGKRLSFDTMEPFGRLTKNEMSVVNSAYNIDDYISIFSKAAMDPRTELCIHYLFSSLNPILQGTVVNRMLRNIMSGAAVSNGGASKDENIAFLRKKATIDVQGLIDAVMAFASSEANASAQGRRLGEMIESLTLIVEGEAAKKLQREIERRARQETAAAHSHTPMQFTVDGFEQVCAENYERIVSSDRAILIFFGSSGCEHCERIGETVVGLGSSSEGWLKIVTADSEVNKYLLERFGITSFPTFILLYRGEEVDRVSGAEPEILKRMISAASVRFIRRKT